VEALSSVEISYYFLPISSLNSQLNRLNPNKLLLLFSRALDKPWPAANLLWAPWPWPCAHMSGPRRCPHHFCPLTKKLVLELECWNLFLEVWQGFPSIELHAPTSSTQKLKLMRKGEQFTYTPTLPLTCRLPQAAYVEYWSGL
jgi:hypothetical protein